MGHGDRAMRIFIPCEFTGEIRDAFRERGHEAVSCDLIPSERPGPHIIGDAREHLEDGWDMMIACPPCTDLAASGARWFYRKQKEQAEALAFVKVLMDASIPRKCIENPVGVISTQIRKPSQIIQPYQFGHGELKTTCLWLEFLPKLQPTNIVSGRYQRVWRMSEGPNRSKDRSRTYPGIAAAMAQQWG